MEAECLSLISMMGSLVRVVVASRTGTCSAPRQSARPVHPLVHALDHFEPSRTIAARNRPLNKGMPAAAPPEKREIVAIRAFRLRGTHAFHATARTCAWATDAELSKLLNAEVAKGAPERLIAAMRHAALAGGKRLRPFLVIETASLFGLEPDRVLRCAAALELIHCYSLVMTTCPPWITTTCAGQAYGAQGLDEWTAILAGDGLLTLAFEVLADPATHADPAVAAPWSS